MKVLRNKKRKVICQNFNFTMFSVEANTKSVHENSYPYLTLLGHLCSFIENNNSDNDFLDCLRVQAHTNGSLKLSLSDIEHYPYSSLLQDLIYKANTNCTNDSNKYKNLKKTSEEGILTHILQSLCYPSIPESADDNCNTNNPLTSYDLTYASILKDLAIQIKLLDCKGNQPLILEHTKFDLSSLLSYLFPSIKIENFSKDMIYSTKLQKLCDELKMTNLVCNNSKIKMEDSFIGYNNGMEDNVPNNDTKMVPIEFLKILEDAIYNETIISKATKKFKYEPNCSPYELLNFHSKPLFIENQTDNLKKKTHRTVQSAKINSVKFKKVNLSSTIKQNLPFQDETILFKTLIENVHSQAMMSHRNDSDANGFKTFENTFPVKQGLMMEDHFNPGLLGETGLKILDKRLKKQLKDLANER